MTCLKCGTPEAGHRLWNGTCLKCLGRAHDNLRQWAHQQWMIRGLSSGEAEQAVQNTENPKTNPGAS